MPTFDSLIGGFRVFKATIYEEQKTLIHHLLVQGAKPTTLVITSSGLRVSPDKLFSCNPGDLYVVRNLAGLIPPYKEGGARGTVSAIEHAICNIGVKNIIVLGHAHCEGIKELLKGETNASAGFHSDNIASDENSKISSDVDPVASWLSIADEAKNAVLRDLADKTFEEQEKACEEEVILVCIKNLLSYPFVQAAIERGNLDIYGWHFDIETGILKSFNPETKFFDPIG